MFVPVKETEILSKMSSGGLQVKYRFTRSPHLVSNAMVSIQLSLNNLGQEDLSDLKVGAKMLANGMTMHEFPGVATLAQGTNVSVQIGINFNDTTQPAKFDLIASGRVFSIQIQAPIGELIRAVSMPEASFNQEKSKLKGMNEVDTKFTMPSAIADESGIKNKVYEVDNVLQVPHTEDMANEILLKFAGQTVASKALVLMTLNVKGTEASLSINCEKIVIGNMLAKEITSAFS